MQLIQQAGHFLRFSLSPRHRTKTFALNHYNMINATQGNSRNVDISHATIKQTIHLNTQKIKQWTQTLFFRILTKLKPHRLKNPFQMYTGFHGPTQLHLALHYNALQHCIAACAPIALHDVLDIALKLLMLLHVTFYYC